MSKTLPIDPSHSAKSRNCTGFINDEFSAHCQEAQGRPFLLTGIRPTLGHRVELTIMLDPEKSVRGGIPFRLSGEVVLSSMPNDSCNLANCGSIISPTTMWRPSVSKNDYGINQGSVALAYAMRSLILKQLPDLSINPEQVAYAWDNLLVHKKAKVSHAIVNKLGALHGDKVTCEVR
jgi:hypothetical protein